MKNTRYDIEISELVGKKIKAIKGLKQYSEEVLIDTECGKRYRFWHVQSCCENVALEDFVLDGNLEGALIVKAKELSSEGTEPESESSTWTFYTIETDKGELFMRWLGESNGYYSERVDIICMDID